jgi:hypothetical protein
MGGRESAGLRSQRVASQVSGSIVAVVEELSTGDRGMAMGGDRGPGKARAGGGSPGSCTVVVLFSRTALEEPFTAAERTSRRGALRRPGRAAVGGASYGSCSVVRVFTNGALEELSTVPEGSIGDGDRGIETPRLMRAPREEPRDRGDGGGTCRPW